MIPRLMIMDEFLPSPHAVHAALTGGEFKDYKSEWDGVVYPGIQGPLPNEIEQLVVKSIQMAIGERIEPVAIFARLTTTDLPDAPHKVHSDRVMGGFAAHIYMSLDWPPNSGTSFWFHNRTMSDYHIDGNDEEYQAHANDLSQWTKLHTVQGAFNRAVIHNSGLWHCAEPVGGWGSDKYNGRIVITCFFNVRK